MANVAEFLGLIGVIWTVVVAKGAKRAAIETKEEMRRDRDQRARLDFAAEVQRVMDELNSLKIHHRSMRPDLASGVLVLYSLAMVRVARLKENIQPTARDSAVLDSLYGQVAIMETEVAAWRAGTVP